MIPIHLSSGIQNLIRRYPLIKRNTTSLQSQHPRSKKLLTKRKVREKLDIPLPPSVNEEVKIKLFKSEGEQSYDIGRTKPGDKKDIISPLPKKYWPSYVEAVWYEWWKKMGFFSPVENSSPSDGVKPFVMVIPPPNVTGELHMGHALTVAIEDSLVRWYRMRQGGRGVVWLPGCDHAGIATQVAVERRLAARGLSRYDVGREEFIREVWEWGRDKATAIESQLGLLGASLDWSRFTFTLDKSYSRAVDEAFIRLYEAGLIRRDLRLVNWCPHLRSAVSDIEVDLLPISGRTPLAVPGRSEPVVCGLLERFEYPVSGSTEVVTVATTRLETLLGDTAVAVHPNDSRYFRYRGSFLTHPISGSRIPIIIDDSVNPDFGSGAVKVTPGHDFTDFELAMNHGLPVITVMDDRGRMISDLSRYHQMDRFIARSAIRDELEQKGLYRGAQEFETLIPVCSRSGDIIEPMLKQHWLVVMETLTRRAVEAVESGELVIHPEHHRKTWKSWLSQSKDWCLSRQIWWGHRVPAYRVEVSGSGVGGGGSGVEGAGSGVGGALDRLTSDDGPWVVGRSHQEALANASKLLSVPESRITLSRDPDVLDTWFSSGLFPFAASGWPSPTGSHYPLSLMETGEDILLFWVARCVTLGLQLTGRLPFPEVRLHAMVRDARGRKMSKSRGNTLDPIHVVRGTAPVGTASGGLVGQSDSERRLQPEIYARDIPQCGADALRFALCSAKSHNTNIHIDIGKIYQTTRFCNKIWNAYKFSSSYFPENSDLLDPLVIKPASVADRWMLSRLSYAVDSVNESFSRRELYRATETLYQLWWSDLCSVYVESVKPRVATCPVVRAVLYVTMDTGLRLISPFMPFLSEELWQRLPFRQSAPSICLAEYPSNKDYPHRDPVLEDDVTRCLDITTHALRIVDENKASPKRSRLYLTNADSFIPYIDIMKSCSRIGSIETVTQRPDRSLSTFRDDNIGLHLQFGTP